jgi:hypothetical protein
MAQQHTTKRYKMRCECWNDVEDALDLPGMSTICLEKSVQQSIDLGNGKRFLLPDFEIVISTIQPLDYVRNLLRDSYKYYPVDLHVMAQTIEEEGAYTGERKRV